MSTHPSHQPWPLESGAPISVLAWPDYRQPAEVVNLFARFGPELAGQPVQLFLRLDPAHDPPAPEVIPLLQQSFDAAGGGQLNVSLINAPMSQSDWPRLGLAVHGMLLLPSSHHGLRAEFCGALGCPLMMSRPALRRLLEVVTPQKNYALLRPSTPGAKAWYRVRNVHTMDMPERDILNLQPHQFYPHGDLDGVTPVAHPQPGWKAG